MNQFRGDFHSALSSPASQHLQHQHDQPRHSASDIKPLKRMGSAGTAPSDIARMLMQSQKQMKTTSVQQQPMQQQHQQHQQTLPVGLSKSLLLSSNSSSGLHSKSQGSQLGAAITKVIPHGKNTINNSYFQQPNVVQENYNTHNTHAAASAAAAHYFSTQKLMNKVKPKDQQSGSAIKGTSRSMATNDSSQKILPSTHELSYFDRDAREGVPDQIDGNRLVQPIRQVSPQDQEISKKMIDLCSRQINNDPQNFKVYEKRVLLYMKAGEYEKAIVDLQKILEIDGNNIHALFTRGNAFMQLKQYRQAIHDFERVLAIDPSHVNAALAKANCFNFMGDYGKAIDQYEDALEKDFEKGSMLNLSLHFNKRNLNNNNNYQNLKSATSFGSSQLGGYFDRLEEEELLMNQYEQHSGFRVLPSQSTKAPQLNIGQADSKTSSTINSPSKKLSLSKQSLFRSASYQIDQHTPNAASAEQMKSKVRSLVQSECASPVLTRTQQSKDKLGLLKQSSSHLISTIMEGNQSEIEEQANTYFTKGYQARQSEDFYRAIELYSVAISLKPDFLKAVINRGFAFDKLGELAKACEDYTRAIEIDNNVAFAYFNRGISLDKQNQLDSALNDFSAAINLDPRNPDFFLNRGNVMQKLEKHVDAAADYSKAIELGTSKKAAVLISRALSYEKCKEFERAKHDYQRALELQTPSKHTCYSRLASIFQSQDNIQLALTLYNKALTENKASLYCLAKRAQVYLKLKLYKLACDDLADAITLNPTIPSLFYYRGKTLKLMGKTLESTEDYLRALSLKPLDEETLSSLSDNLMEMGEFEESKRYIEVEIDEFGVSDERIYKRHICSIRLGNYESAEIDLRSLLKSGLEEVGEEDLGLLRNLSACLMRQKKFSEAEEVLSKIIDRSKADTAEQRSDLDDLIRFRGTCREKMKTR